MVLIKTILMLIILKNVIIALNTIRFFMSFFNIFHQKMTGQPENTGIIRFLYNFFINNRIIIA